MTAAEKVSTELGTAAACRAFGVAPGVAVPASAAGGRTRCRAGPPTVTSGIECRRAASRPRPAA